MTGRTGKGQAKSKAKQHKEPVIVKGSITVRDCLTWQHQDGFQEQDTYIPEPTGYYLPSKAELGRAKSRGYEMPPSGAHPNHDEDGRVIDALRGWPHHRGDQDGFDDMAFMDQQDGGGGGGGKKGGDPWMGDLISHKFMMDAIRKRREEEEAAARKAAAKARKANPGKGDIRGNRTSQLRAIAMAEKVETNPQDLWQMPKFKNNAKPHLTTTTKRAQHRGEQTRYGSASGMNGYDATGNADPCTCYDNDPGLYDGGRPDSNTQDYHYGPVNNDLDDYAFGDGKDDNKLFAV
jgi:hypothetical protein